MVAALMERESLDEKDILEVTGLPPAPALAELPLVVGEAKENAARE